MWCHETWCSEAQCNVVWCEVMWGRFTWCGVVLCHAVSCNAMWCIYVGVTWSDVMSLSEMLWCYILSRYVTSCEFIHTCAMLWCEGMGWDGIWCDVTWDDVMSCDVMWWEGRKGDVAWCDRRWRDVMYCVGGDVSLSPQTEVRSPVPPQSKLGCWTCHISTIIPRASFQTSG